MRQLDFAFMAECLGPIVIQGVPVAIRISVIAFVFGAIIGLLVALTKIYDIPVLKQISVVYISLFRGTPLLVQILIAYYGVPILLNNIGVLTGLDLNINNVSTYTFLYVVYSLNAGSYMSETIRAAILSVDRGQLEAGLSIGMTTPQVLWRIILPQAVKVAIPSLGNSFISLTKETSLAFVVSVPDILGQAKIIAGRTTRFFEAYIVAALVYWAVCIICELLLRVIEEKSRKHERRN